MTLRCSRCSRPLQTATVMTISGCSFGPVCAAKMGLSTGKENTARVVSRRRVIKHADGQLSLFEISETAS